ncbi:MAG TPA: flagellar basal body P-ring formation chaperone FlgA [Opitutaceae bacterium]|nr:flagellar basal body P-ring formation chaperone FlgA [Opitutaceae bacterium]
MRARLFILFVACAGLLAAAGQPATPAAYSREQLLAGLAQDLSAHYRLDGELQLELLRPWSPPARTAAAWTLAVLDYPAAPSGSMLVRFELRADGEAVADQTLVVRAALWRDVWVARQPLALGAQFDPAQLDTRRVDAFRERDALPASAGDRAYIFARGVAAGRLLTWHDLGRRPLVRRGQLVEVSAVEGLLTITMKGLAMENGAQGDTVTIRNPESHKDFSALVVDENHVQVRF